jgi:hypothetical protein
VPQSLPVRTKKVSGEPRTAVSHRNLENWGELKEFIKNTYIKKNAKFSREPTVQGQAE